MGDFNARVGERTTGEDIVLGPYSYGNRTRNGEKLMELSFENNLRILNTDYKNRSRWTWSSPGGVYKNEIVYILTNRSKAFEDCRNVKNLNFNSNHRMIRAKFSINKYNEKRKIHFNSRSKREICKEELKLHLQHYEETASELQLQDKYNKLEDIINNITKINSKNISKSKNITSTTTRALLEEEPN
ncbi:unnamed protein product [Euphydryas editha]|uniref:Craniofacial development protein 2 n=1 Tax=Euphydryas editha TaxID=104508 RepID=A0AAU9TCN1_EUPED|nr:unnamed protein product [Euphydryas editha]